MSLYKFLVIAFTFFFSILSLHAQLEIAWVSDSSENSAGFTDDGFVLFLEFEGHTVSRFDFGKDGGGSLSGDDILLLESFDLVIISRDTNPDRYSDATSWNQLLVPIINLNPNLLFSERWGWENISQSSGVLSSSSLAETLLPGDPIFRNAKESRNELFALVESSTSLLNAGGTTGRGRVRSLDGSGNVWVSQWEAGLPFFEGGTQITNGKRMFFAAGDAGSGIFNLSIDGEEVFRNAIALMTSNGEILWVSDDNKNEENEFIDAGFVAELESRGFFVWRDRFAEETTRTIDFNDSLDLTDEEKTLLVMNDLIVFSRNTLSRTYNDVAGWNSIETPILVMNPYLLRPQRWGWVPQNALVRVKDRLGLAVSGDPLLTGVTINDSSADTPGLAFYNAGPITGGDVPGRITFRLPADQVGTPRVISRGREDEFSYSVLSTWSANEPYYNGSELSPAGDRIYFSAGVDAKAGTSTVGALNLTADGETVLGNLVDSLLNDFSILWISEADDDSADGSLIDLLRTNGYTVYLDTELPSRSSGTPSLADNGQIFFPRQKVSELVDLIIFSRNTDEDKYTDTAGWNALNAPIMVLNPELISTSGFSWYAGAGTVDSTNDFAPIDFTDAIYDGVDDSSATFPLTDSSTTLADVSGAGNGEGLGFDSSSDLWIARWAPGIDFFSGSGNNAGGWKLFFAAGDDTNGTIGENNLTADGQLIFLNAVADLIERSQSAE